MRLIGGYLVFVAIGLAIVWLGMWGAYAFAGRPTPIDPEAFKVVAALDLSFMVPTLTVGGVLLWKRRAWGYLASTSFSDGEVSFLLGFDDPNSFYRAFRSWNGMSPSEFRRHSAAGT